MKTPLLGFRDQTMYRSIKDQDPSDGSKPKIYVDVTAYIHIKTSKTKKYL